MVEKDEVVKASKTKRDTYRRNIGIVAWKENIKEVKAIMIWSPISTHDNCSQQIHS